MKLPESIERDVFLQIPWPPSVNHMYNWGKNGVYLNAKARNWYVDAKTRIFCQIYDQQIKDLPIREVVQIDIKAYPPDKRCRDEGNLRKAIDDVLVKAGILEDDVLIKKVTSEVYLFNNLTKSRGIEIKISAFIQSLGSI